MKSCRNLKNIKIGESRPILIFWPVKKYILKFSILLCVCLLFQCHGPKFRRNDCCEGFICVALYKPGAEDVLECVDEDEHFRVKSIAEILEEVDRELGQSVPYKQNYNKPLLLDDKSLASFIKEISDMEREDGSLDLKDFNNPILLENPSYKNITI